MKIEQQVLHQQERHLSINTFQRSVEEECIRTERDIALLEEQLRQCRSKLRELKQTVVGQFHAERTKLQKQGIDLLQFRSDQLHYLHDHLKDVTDKVLDVLEGRLRKKMFNAYFAQYVEDAELSEEELFTLFDDLMSEYTEQVQSKHRSKGNFTAPRGKRKR